MKYSNKTLGKSAQSVKHDTPPKRVFILTKKKEKHFDLVEDTCK